MDNKIIQWKQNIKNVSNSDTFCVLPWIHFATRPNGDMRLCCSANASDPGGDHGIGLVRNDMGVPSNFETDTPMGAWNTEYMKNVRTTMLKGEIPASCNRCFKEESNGFSSKRLWETNYWINDGIDVKELIESTSSDGTVPEKLVYLDLRLGHTCQLKCVMCSPHDSSRWVKEHQTVYPTYHHPILQKYMGWDNKFNNYWYENPTFWDQLYEQIPNLRQVYFAGGEPLMIKEHKKFLEEIVKRGYGDKIQIRYNTNGVLIDESMIELWSNFKEVRVGFSLDAFGDRNTYIRYPTDWNDVERALEILDNSPNNIDITLVPAIQIMNIKHFPDFVKWKINKKFKKIGVSYNNEGLQHGGGIFNFHVLHIPHWLGIKALPKEDKLEVERLFSELKTWLYENYTQDESFWVENPYAWPRYEALINVMNSEDHSDLLPAFREYVNKLDNYRGNSFSETFPELKHLL